MEIIHRLQRKAMSLASPMLFDRYFSKGQKTEKRNTDSGHDISTQMQNRPTWPGGKKFAVTISFDYDFPEDVAAIPRLLDLLEAYEISASHAVIGKFVERDPKPHQKILERHDEIINHTYSHPNNETFNPDHFFNRMTEPQQEEEIAGFEKVAHDSLDYRAPGFRTPHFGNLHTQSVYQILERRGYRYSSSTTLTTTESWGLPYRPARNDFHNRGQNVAPNENNDSNNENGKTQSGYPLWELPMMACPEHYKPLFDSWHCFRSHPPAHQKAGDFLRLFTKAMALGEKYGAYMNFYFDPRDVVDLADFEKSLALLKEKKAWAAKSEDVAAWFDKNDTAAEGKNKNVDLSQSSSALTD
ncbi:polysaccharide deacetylase family protein [Candidatus Micrarchaeota archaeon]|nr:polysaccharide deacetylase family protein [Candidatus Micrarchaeota archaeon]